MNHPKNHRDRILLAAALFLPLPHLQSGIPAGVQSGISARVDDPKPKPGDVPLPLPGLGGDHDDPHVEMKRLFGRIESDLRQIDKMLAEASSGPGAGGTTAAAKSKTSAAVEGIDKLLSTSEERGKSVIDSIDRILELARHEPSESSSSCESAGGMCKSSGSKGNSKEKGGGSHEPGQDESGRGRSLLDRQGGTSTQREATPEGPGQDGEHRTGEKPGPKDGSRDAQGKTGPKPAGNQSSKTPAENNAVDPNGDPKSGDPHGANGTVDKWGDLPVHVRDVFRTQGGGDMPAQYRDWIDAYYRRMAKKAGS